jgi:hypothetical protein
VKPRRTVTSLNSKLAASAWPTIPRWAALAMKSVPGLRRMEQGRHVVFYRAEPGDILISRILHQRMLPENQDLDDEDLTSG